MVKKTPSSPTTPAARQSAGATEAKAAGTPAGADAAKPRHTTALRKPATYYRADVDSLRSQNNLGRLLKLSYASLIRMVDEYVAPMGLTAMQWKPLVIICHQNTNTPAEVSRRAMVDTGAMTRTLDRLEAKGFLRRQRCETDRRVVNLELTDAGRDVVNDILPAVAKAFNTHLAGFSDKEIETLLSLLGRLIENGHARHDSDPPDGL